jgi:hypothetical protein
MSGANVDRQWFIVSRWQQYDGEQRANLLRIGGIATFYLIHLINYRQWFGLPGIEGATPQFDEMVTALAVAWVLTALAVQLALARHVFPGALKFVTTSADIWLLTLVIGVCDGPRSPLVVGYFLILAVASLRFSLRLVWCATIECLAGYGALVIYAEHFATRDKSVPRYSQMIFLAALLIAGVTMGAVVRRVRRLAFEFAQRIGEGAAAAESLPRVGEVPLSGGARP